MIENPHPKTPTEYDSLLLCQNILLYKEGQFVLESDQAVAISQGQIQYVGKPSPLLKAKHVYRMDRKILCPGFVNTHTHLPMSLFRGLADNLPLMVWLKSYIFPLESHFVNEDFVRIGTELSLIELIRSGVTTCYDMYFYNQVLAETLDRSGLRGTVAVGIPSLEKDGREWEKKTLALHHQFKNHPRLKVGLAPHSPYTVDSKTLTEIGEFSQSENLPLSIHVSESLWEQEEIQKKHKLSPVQYLHQLGVTGPLSLFVHCVHVNSRDLEIMAESKTSLSYNPSSNMKLGNGIAPIGEALEKGVVVGLGTDGSASNNNLNFFEEMGTGAKLQALKYGDRSLTAEQTLQVATIGGAKAMGLEREIGSITVGKRADLIALDIDHISFQPFYKPISNIVYSALGSEVSFVMCEGEVLMEDQELKTLDEEKIFSESRILAQKIQDFIKNRQPR